MTNKRHPMLKQETAGKYTVLVTGASGFVGRHVGAYLRAAGFEVRVAVRGPSTTLIPLPAAGQQIAVGDIGPATSWDAALEGVEAVVHLASHSPVAGATPAETAAAYRRVNVSGTECLARAAAAAGVRRLVYVSTIKVNGEGTPLGELFSAASPPRPQDAYGQSKWQAEQILHEISSHTGLESVIVRLPLVYGPGVRANFLALLRLVERGLPVPLRRVRNRRSMLYVGNLADAIVRCLDAKEARGQTYLLSDGEDLSTPELIERIALHMERPARLWPVPVSVLRGLGHLIGKQAMIDRLTGSLLVDSRKIREQLEWTPPFTLDEGLRATIQWYLCKRGK